MRILFIYPNIVESPKDISTGLAVLSAICKEKGHQTDIIDSTFGISDKEALDKVSSFNPELIAVTTATNDFDYATRLCTLIKSKFDVPILAGGFHPTIAPEEVISKDCFDFICIGEGENALIELIACLEKKKSPDRIKNLWVKKKENDKIKVIKNPIRNLVQELDKLPFPDRELFDYEKYLKWNHGTATFLTTRGCPFQCTYCINHFLTKLCHGKGKYVRFRSINSLLKEIKEVTSNYKEHIKNIEFYDDTFTLDEKRIEEFCKKYPEEIGLPFNVNARVNAVNPKILKMLKEAGCVRVSIGVEAGDEEIRNKVLKRDMTSQKIIETFQAAREVGLKTYSFNMVGIPFETKKSIQKTIELNQKCKPDYVGVSIFNAFKGTEIYNLCKAKGWLREGYSKSYFRDSNIAHENFTIPQLRRIRNSFGFKVFLKNRPLRAVVDLLDRNLSSINSYIFIRSKLISWLNVLKK